MKKGNKVKMGRGKMRCSTVARNRLLTKLVIQEAMNQALSNEEKQAIQLFMKNYKQKRIAAVLSMPQSRVDSLIASGLWKMRSFLGKA